MPTPANPTRSIDEYGDALKSELGKFDVRSQRAFGVTLAERISPFYLYYCSEYKRGSSAAYIRLLSMCWNSLTATEIDQKKLEKAMKTLIKICPSDDEDNRFDGDALDACTVLSTAISGFLDDGPVKWVVAGALRSCKRAAAWLEIAWDNPNLDRIEWGSAEVQAEVEFQAMILGHLRASPVNDSSDAAKLRGLVKQQPRPLGGMGRGEG